MNYTNYRHYRDYVDDTDFKKWLKLQKLLKLLQWLGQSALQLCRGSEVTQVTLLSCNYFASFHKDTVTSYIITFITRGEFFFKRQNFGTQQFWHLITLLHTLQKKNKLFLRKSLKKLQYYILYKKNDLFFWKIGVKMTTNYMITYITGGLIFWSDEKCHVSSHI